MALMEAMAETKRRSKTPDRPGLDASELVELGAAALKAKTESEEHRMATVSDYLSTAKEWPNRRLLLTAIDLADSSLTVWNKRSSATLVEAVASSCAAPLVARPGPLRPALSAEVDTLCAGGSRVEVIVPDAESMAVLFADLLDERRRPRCAEAGYAQGAAAAAALRDRLAAP
jgi:NTE family protein